MAAEGAISKNLVTRPRPRLADALVGVDFDSLPPLDIYGSRFKERAEALDKINIEVAKTLYDWKPRSAVNGNCKESADSNGTAGEQEPSQADNQTTRGPTSPDEDIVVVESAPPAKPTKPKRQSRATKNMLREIDRMKAVALACSVPETEQLMDTDVLDDEVLAKIEREYEYNKTITVRITDHRGNIKKYTMLMRESFVKVFDDLAQEHQIEREQVMLTHKETFIQVYDTPVSIDLHIGDVIDFCKLTKPAEVPLTERDKANRVTLKVQSATSRKRIEITINKVDPLSRLMKEYCKMSGQDLAKLSFKFDDEDIEPDSTPSELELEDGYCIDVIEIK